MFHFTGLAGDNDLQNAEIGSIVDFIVDIGKSCENVMKETDEAKKVCMQYCDNPPYPIIYSSLLICMMFLYCIESCRC